MARTFIRIPSEAKPGEIIEVKAMIEHPQHSGFRLDHVGKPIPRHIVTTFTCTYGGQEVFRADFHPSIATNPYVGFFLRVRSAAELVLTWIDDRGAVVEERPVLNVT
jgi:sulfur-oxidizing protein SoxZ